MVRHRAIEDYFTTSIHFSYFVNNTRSDVDLRSTAKRSWGWASKCAGFFQICIPAHAFLVVAHELGAFFDGDFLFAHGSLDLLAELGDEFVGHKLDAGEDFADGVAADDFFDGGAAVFGTFDVDGIGVA